MKRLVMLVGVLGTVAYGGEVLTVNSLSPSARTLTAPVGGSIRMTFDRPVDRSTVTSDTLHVFGRWSGPAEGNITFEDDDRVVVFDPAGLFSSGELVFVSLSGAVSGADGVLIQAGGFAWSFWTAASPSTMVFTEIETYSTRTTPGASSRAYGGIASDIDGDGWLDMTIVNEVTADLRVFLNDGGEMGTFADFIQPTFPVNTQASPSEPADFNGDGAVDICVANISTSSVSVLLGVGDGTFGPHQEITVGSQPRGIAVLDVEGDGDVDIVNTNFGNSNLSVLLNDGSGVFGAPTFFDAGLNGEFALASADMNEDGLFDLIVGARAGQQVVVALSNGDGTFTSATPQSAGGSPWMLVCGDVNGDGHEDVAVANSFSNNGAVLLGDGEGGLGFPQLGPTDPFPLATDLGDLDGDGDLDWTTSSFQGDWFVFENDGLGTFTFVEEFAAPEAASCTLLFDVDNDRDLDMALIDELEDVVIVMRNGGVSGLGDFDNDGDVDLSDFGLFQICFTGPVGGPVTGNCMRGDFDGDGNIDLADFGQFQIVFTGAL